MCGRRTPLHGANGSPVEPSVLKTIAEWPAYPAGRLYGHLKGKVMECAMAMDKTAPELAPLRDIRRPLSG